MNNAILELKKTELKNKKVAHLIFLASFFFALTVFLPYSVHAQDVSFSSTADVSRVIENIARFMSTLLIAVSVIVIIVAGFIYLTAGDDEKKVTTATQTLTYAIVGIVVGLVAFSIPPLIKAILG